MVVVFIQLFVCARCFEHSDLDFIFTLLVSISPYLHIRVATISVGLLVAGYCCGDQISTEVQAEWFSSCGFL